MGGGARVIVKKGTVARVFFFYRGGKIWVFSFFSFLSASLHVFRFFFFIFFNSFSFSIYFAAPLFNFFHSISFFPKIFFFYEVFSSLKFLLSLFFWTQLLSLILLWVPFICTPLYSLFPSYPPTFSNLPHFLFLFFFYYFLFIIISLLLSCLGKGVEISILVPHPFFNYYHAHYFVIWFSFKFFPNLESSSICKR